MKAGTKIYVRSYRGSPDVARAIVISGPHWVGYSTWGRGQECYIIEAKESGGKYLLMVPIERIFPR